ncbi:MAG: cupin domain-containing protein [Bacillota bacterium]|nr:cupin domain-containing protein [Bacillota bacterium]
MIKKAENMEIEIKDQMRGGKGSVEIMHIFKQQELTGKARLCAKISINPGCSIGLHEHVNEEEIFYVIKGKGIVNDNGEVKEVAKGDSILTGGGAVHSIENTGSDVLELVAVILLYDNK